MSDLLDLPPERAMPTDRVHARRHLLQRHLAAATPPRRRPAVRYLVTVGAAGAVLAGGTAAAYIATRPASVPVVDQTRCYTKASLAGGDEFAGTTVGMARSADGRAHAVTAIEAC